MKKIISASIILLLTMSMAACDEDGPELDKFTQVKEDDIFKLKPAVEHDYYDIRLVYPLPMGASGTPNVKIKYAQGEMCENAGDKPACVKEANKMSADTGFAVGCLPAICFHNILYTHKDQISLAATQKEVLAFLGEIDNSGDALFWIFVNGYEFDMQNKLAGGVRETSAGYEILAKKIVSYCSPLQTDWFWLEVNKKGTITVKRQEVLSKNDDLCI